MHSRMIKETIIHEKHAFLWNQKRLYIYTCIHRQDFSKKNARQAGFFDSVLMGTLS